MIKNEQDGDKYGWVLGNWNRMDSQLGFREDFFTPYKADFFYPLTSFGNSLLHLIIKEDSFSVTSVRGDDDGRLNVGFFYSVKSQQGRLANITGQMMVDPSRSYVVLESRRTTSLSPEREFIVKRDIDASPEAPGGFHCKSYDFTVVNHSTRDAEPMALYHHDYHDYSYHPIPDEVFRLSHYGLPEPLDAPPLNSSRLSPWLWIVSTALALVGAAVGLRKLARRT